jgi:hypothetical protein
MGGIFITVCEFVRIFFSIFKRLRSQLVSGEEKKLTHRNISVIARWFQGAGKYERTKLRLHC